MAIITFQRADISVKIPNKKILKNTIQELFHFEHQPLKHLDYIFCSDEYLLKINNDFLQHDYYTDIITFCLSEPSQPIEGEVYISYDRVRDNAKTHQTIEELELLRVIFHGALHLCGYKDKTSNQTKLMRQKEDHYIHAFLNVPRETSI